jgi:hypothetical protein
VPNLKDHILPRIKNMLLNETASSSGVGAQPAQASLFSTEENNTTQRERDSVLIKNDRMYLHHLGRFNFTTYDVRRAQDVINPDTSHCDIMLVANTGNTESDTCVDHPFLYARVLGIYHVNAIYTGEGMLDYNTRRVDFLWVRWFRYVGSRSCTWNDLRLDSVDFPPMATEGTFGFVDPRDVLRGCHIIPTFACGNVHLDRVGLSRCAHDAHDWRRYYINRCVIYTISLANIIEGLDIRFVDRDMIMRYHWGLAIGHTYSHGQPASAASTFTDDSHSAMTGELEEQIEQINHATDPDIEDLEFSLENLEDDLGDRDGGSDEEHGEDSDDEQHVVMYEMYGPDYFDIE